jgi:hypothetical protein
VYPLADDITIDASPLGVRVRTVDGSGACLLTTMQAEELADLVREWTWAGVLCGGGSVLTVKACESCVVVRCSGHASAEELERFAAELTAVAAQARRYVPPETGWGKKKQRAQGAR